VPFTLFFKTNIAIKKETFLPEQDEIVPEEFHGLLAPSTTGSIHNYKNQLEIG
jgi:hypothetical protein